MKKFRLKKDLPMYKAGTMCRLTANGNLITLEDNISSGKMLFCKKELAKFPNILKDWFEEIPEEPKTVWDLKLDDRWYFTDGSGDVGSDYWTGDSVDLRYREVGNCFLSEDEAKREIARRKAEVILKRDTKGLTVNNAEKFYSIYWDVSTQTLKIMEWNPETCYVKITNPIRFATKGDARFSMEDHEKEWKIYLGVEE